MIYYLTISMISLPLYTMPSNYNHCRNVTGTTSMCYNAPGRRIRTKKQLDYTNKKIDALYLQTDLARLSLLDTTGIIWGNVTADSDLLGDTAKVFTTGNRLPDPTLLSSTGSKWEITDLGTSMTYQGDADLVNIFALVTLKPNTTNKSIQSIAVNTPGSGYLPPPADPPAVTITGDGTNAAAVAVVNPATGAISSITVTSGGAGYTTATAAIAVSPTGDNAALGTNLIVAKTVVSVGIAKTPAPQVPPIPRYLLLSNSTIGDPATQFTTNVIISEISQLKKGDKFELVMATDSTSTLSYTIYNAVLGTRPLNIV